MVTRGDAIAAVMVVARRIEGELTVSNYNTYKDRSHPHGDTIARKFGWNRIKEEAGLERRPLQSTITEHTATTAMQTVNKRFNGRLTIRAYDLYRDEHHPSGQGICDKLGWNTMKQAANVDHELVD